MGGNIRDLRGRKSDWFVIVAKPAAPLVWQGDVFISSPQQGDSVVPKMIYVNLPVRDLAASTRFYEALGCTKNPQFSSEKAASMVWSDTISFQLLTRDYFATFISREIADAHKTCAVLIALTCGSREEVDALAKTAALSGGKADVRDIMDMGWLYNRALEDPDGHVLEAVWLDASALAMAGQSMDQTVEHA
jgi:uncharacterized protein